MRGKEFANDLIPAEVRITPAYAGKRSNFIPLLGNLQDHPRLCGEKTSRTRISLHSQGSPPPMRGKDEWEQRTGMGLGDHPRLCGEKVLKFDL